VQEYYSIVVLPKGKTFFILQSPTLFHAKVIYWHEFIKDYTNCKNNILNKAQKRFTATLKTMNLLI